MSNLKKDIKHREDITVLVSRFYSKVRVHHTLGPIFNQLIKDWDRHLVHITDFWESSFLMTQKYQGNPVTVHQKVDRQTSHVITMDHFGIWINLWKETIDELYKGDIAQLAINRARNMASILFIKIFEAREN